MKFLFAILFIIISFALPPDQENVTAPGIVGQIIYSGYLPTTLQTRKIHYVFISARYDPQNAPLVIWLNGGPGCSSLIGMLQQLGPYLVGNSYKKGDSLTKNQYSWNNIANLLFLQSPAIVGFSSDKDPQFPYTDQQTADDAFIAIRSFITEKASQFADKQLFITGQSYAGKYIPDITVRILQNNRQPQSHYIHLKGILVGNGVMNFQDYSLDKSSIQYMGQHDFISTRLWDIYQSSCKKDFQSPRCKYFRMELQYIDQSRINPYCNNNIIIDVYQICKKSKQSEFLRLKQAIKSVGKFKKFQIINKQTTIKKDNKLKQIKECPSENGAIEYWNFAKQAFHVTKYEKTWSPCTNLNYKVTDKGSMQQYRQIFLNRAVKVWMYNGDWDDVVPYRDSQKNLQKLIRQKKGQWQAWYYGQEKHHAGFYQQYDSLLLLTVKGAGHMVPQTQPKYAYQMFYNFIHDQPLNTPVQNKKISDE